MNRSNDEAKAVVVIPGEICLASSTTALPLRRLTYEERRRIARILCQHTSWKWFLWRLGMRGLWVPNPQYITEQPVQFTHRNQTHTIPMGYVTDGATFSLDSIGRPQWLVHDYLYSHKVMSQREADLVFSRVAPWRVWLLKWYHWKQGDYCTTYINGHVHDSCECKSPSPVDDTIHEWHCLDLPRQEQKKNPVQK